MNVFDGKVYGFSNYEITAIAIDKNNIKWIGNAFGGLTQFKGKH